MKTDYEKRLESLEVALREYRSKAEVETEVVECIKVAEAKTRGQTIWMKFNFPFYYLFLKDQELRLIRGRLEISESENLELASKLKTAKAEHERAVKALKEEFQAEVKRLQVR